MNLKQTDLSAIEILNDAQLNQSAINASLQKLVENDIQLANPNGCAPKIWECKWYNDQSISGYPKGYAVWYNTESPDQFIAFHATQIYNYAKNNTHLKKIIQPYSVNSHDLYYNILTGYFPQNISQPLQPLYDIGDISQPVQIKISLKDNNKDTPNTLSSWKNFIIRDNYSGVSAMINNMLSVLMEQHMTDYHFDNNSFAGNISDYLLKNLSNMKNLQRYNSHTSTVPISGFEYVKKFVKVPIKEDYIYSVIESEYDTSIWKLKDYDHITTNGVLNNDTKSYYRSKMEGCANYISANIEGLIADLTDKAIVGISYSGINTSIIPKQTDDYSIISSRLDKYNCVFKVLPLTGFDTYDIGSEAQYYTKTTEHNITHYPRVKYTYNKWFRYWSSGKLEYGGIIPVNDQHIIDVEFGWRYTENGKTYTAPIYDYPTTVKSFYGPYTQFSTAIDAKYDAYNNLKQNCRYIVQLSPVYSTLQSHLSSDSLDYVYDEQFHDYATNEANTFKNNGFKIYIDSVNGAKYFQYYVTGFRMGN